MARERKSDRDLPERPIEAEEQAAGEPVEQKEPRTGPLESIFQETVRRAAGLGFSSFFLTEEALRRAFSEAAPKDLVQYVSEQSERMRDQVIDRVSREFGDWLQTVDVRELLEEVLTNHEFELNVSISASRKKSSKGSSLKVVTRRK